MTVATLAVGTLAADPVAADPTGITANEAAAALGTVPGLLADTVRASSTKTDDIIVTSTVAIPDDPTDGINLGALTIGLPGTGDADDAVKVNAGTVVYPSDGDYATAVQATAAGDVRALVIIDSDAAPTDFRFPVAGATHLTADPHGGINVWAGDAIVATVATPWAIDAQGMAIPTSYRIDGTTIIQTVSHDGAAYPVVADPQFTWGWVTGTVYFTRAETNAASTVAGFIGLAGFFCTYGLATGPFAIAFCAGAALHAGVIALAANYWYNQGKCLKIKLPLFEPGSVSYGDRNCR
jgi:hypothetical protein